MSWKTAVNINLIVQNADLMEVFLLIAPNTVLQPQRMQKAIEYENAAAQINFSGDPIKHFSDWTGALVRMGLAKIRECRNQEV